MPECSPPLPKERYFSVENEEKVEKFMSKLRKLIKTLFMGEEDVSEHEEEE